MSDRGNPRGRGQIRGRGGPPGDMQGRGGGPHRGGGRGGGGFDRGGPPGGGRGGGGPPAGRGRGGFGGPVIFSENVPAQIPPHLSPQNLQKLVDDFKSLKKVGPERPLRPGYGTVGTPVTLRANFFPLRLPKGPIFDYNVEISPKTDINRLKIRIFELMEQTPECKPFLPFIAHDRSQRLVAAKKLPQPLDLRVPFYEDNEKKPGPGATVYTVSIKFERELDLSQLTKYKDGEPGMRDFDTLPLVSALNLVLQTHASRTGVRVGKNRYFFPSSSEPFQLGVGIQAFQGFYSSVRIVQKEIAVNVNACMTAFIEPGNLADRMHEFSQNSRGGMPTIPKSMMRSLKVRTKHLGYKKGLGAIGTTPPRNTFFDCAEFGGKISVEQYFLKKYKIKLRYPTELPVVNIGTSKKKNLIPPELCEIEPGNPYFGKLNDKETAQMIRYACNPPKINAEAITRRGFTTLGLSPAQGPLQGFGITVETDMMVVPGRELPPPRLSYKGNERPRIQNGSWNILDVKFHRGATVATWWILPIHDGKKILQGPQDPRLKGLVEGFANKLRKSGVGMPQGFPRLLQPPEVPHPAGDPDRTMALAAIRKRIADELKSGPKPSFILVLLENRDNYIYPGIKRIGDVELGVHTIHMQLEKALNDSKQDQYFSNVALKVNTKLGGMNHLLDDQAMRWLKKKPTMMVGIDVTHPGPGSREGTPSIAAVVASVDDSFVQFPCSMGIQESKQEMLDKLADMLVERLLVYEKKNKVLPARIFVYRDGVSEGQFDTVITDEVPQILKAFQKLSTKGRKTAYRPQISVIICGKRHHVRPYATNSQFADRNGNTRPGTVVDKGITGVFDYDFYLQAHAGLQGNVKGTHYTVIYDENDLQPDDIQVGTHDTSYLYARATKAVSLIPAAYYADLACERGRCYLNDFLVDDKTTTAGGSGKADKDAEKKKVFDAAVKAWGEGLHPDMRGSMFYI